MCYVYVRHQVGLEFVQVDVEGTVEAKRSRDGGNNLSDETVQVGEAWGRDVEAFLANIVDSFVIDHEGTVGVLESGVGRENRVVGLNDRVGHGRSGVHAELELGLLAIVGGKTLENESTKTGAGSTAERVGHEESLETIAVVGQPADLAHYNIDLLLANGVVTTSVYGH